MFDMLLWHMVDADDAQARAIVALGHPCILLVHREQLDDRLGSGQRFRTPLPSLPEPVWYIILPFLDDELELLISTIARRLGI
ncbi:hypothetical protein F8S13_01345 [Chloroflexia bacterium SDU3-3]|nr:hypothetical protein F8S13_01345 [Chloroflexia bacterium SDU3-3]